MLALLCALLLAAPPALAQVAVVENPVATNWHTAVDGNAPGARQTVATVGEGGATWLRWTVRTNTDGKFTGYGVSRDVTLDLSRAGAIRWRWRTSGRYLQLQLWAGDRLAFWDTHALQPGRWRTETVAPSGFHYLAGFRKTDWAHITRVGLRIADSFAGYDEGKSYEMGLRFIHAYGPLGAPGPLPPAAGPLHVEDTAAALSVGSNRYRLELDKARFSLQLYLPGAKGLTPVSPDGLFYGFDVDHGHSFDAHPVYQVVERTPRRVVIAAGAELPLPTHDALLVTFTCLPDRVYTAVRYHTPLDCGYASTRFGPSGSAVKGFFDHYAFRDSSGALHRGCFAEYEPRAGFGLSTFDHDGDYVSAFSSEKPYLYLWKAGAGRGLAVVYIDYDRRWRDSVQNCHFCDYTPEMDYFHLGLGYACDTAETRVACLYADVSDDPALIDKVVVPQILAQARSLDLKALTPAGFRIRTDSGAAQRAVLRRLQETWGNHMHWIGVGWGGLNGDDVLATSIDQTERMMDIGAEGAVNFDMVGVERLATARPAALAKLRRLLATGRLEVAGASYGQPLGNLTGAESNVRQLQWGGYVCRRYLGFTPKTWWEEEFDFFPQLPQLLKLMGFDGACLYFQRTWMDPSFPVEDSTCVVKWEAPDGSRILTAAHTALSRWMPGSLRPRELAKAPVAKKAAEPLIVEWNELTGTDPKTVDGYRPTYRAMKRFDIKPTTLASYLASYKGSAPDRPYRMDQTFTGLAYGKCGDRVRIAYKRLENTITSAEALGAGASTEGLAYPAAALHDAWKNLMIFEGHDVNICEGVLRGAYPKYEDAAGKKARSALDAVVVGSAAKVDTRGKPGALAAVVVFNSLAWARSGPVEVALPGGTLPGKGGPVAVRDANGTLYPAQITAGGDLLFVARDLPPVGYRTYWLVQGTAPTDLRTSPNGRSLSNSAIVADLDATGALRALRDTAVGAQLLSPDEPNGELCATIGGRSVSSSTAAPALKLVEAGPVRAVVEATGALTDRTHFVNRVVLYSRLPEVVFETDLDVHQQLDGLMTGALRRVFTPSFHATYYQDWPFGVSRTAMSNEFDKAFPFPASNRIDKVRNFVSGLNFLDCQGARAGLLYANDGNQGFLRLGAEIANLLSCYDPWDQGYYPEHQAFRSALIAHGAWSNSDRLRAAIGFNTPLRAVVEPCRAGPWPTSRSWLRVESPTAIVSAFYRETPEADDASAGASAGVAGKNLLLRLYDVDGKRQEVRVEAPFPLAGAELVDLRGASLRALRVEGGAFRFSLAPYQIATIRLIRSDQAAGR